MRLGFCCAALGVLSYKLCHVWKARAISMFGMCRDLWVMLDKIWVGTWNGEKEKKKGLFGMKFKEL